MSSIARDIYRTSRGNLRPCVVVAKAKGKAVVRVGRTLVRHAVLSRDIPKGAQALIDLSETPPVILPADTSLTGDIQGDKRIIRIPAGATTQQILDLFGGAPRLIPAGSTLIFQFDDGTFTIDTPITIEGFYGGGKLIIRGNPADDVWGVSSASVTIDGTATQGKVFSVNPVGVNVEIQRMRILCSDTSTSSSCIYVNEARVKALHLLLEAVGTSSARCISVNDRSMAHILKVYITGGYYGLYAGAGSYVIMHDVDDLNTQPAYGIKVWAAIVSRSATMALNGSVADTVVGAGGQIW